MHSFWERENWLKEINCAIIGSGIVGINCALELRKKFPKAKIVIFEKGYFPAGASSKNAGFACFGSPSEILSDLSTMSEDEVFQLIETRIKGLELLKKTCGDNIDFEKNGSYEVFTKKDELLFEKCKNNLTYLNKILHPIFNSDCFSLDNEKIKEFGFSEVENVIYNQFEGQINTGKMIAKLIAMCYENNIQIINGVTVKKIEDTEKKVIITLDNDHFFSVDKLFVATNGFAAELLTNIDLKPARAQVLITKPIKDLAIRGTFHMDQGFYYFRNVENRILIGGGRNLDIDGETTTKLETTRLIQESLINLLKDHIIPKKEFEIDMQWAGIMGVGKVKKPILKKVSSNVFCGIRMGGMGVAIGSIVGQNLAKLFVFETE